MAEENTTSVATVAAATALWSATLKVGNVYVLGNTFFYKDVPVTIDDATKATLETDAVDPATVQVGEDITTEMRPKFVFTPAPTARSRSRA
jgi:hypothetical protein